MNPRLEGCHVLLKPLTLVFNVFRTFHLSLKGGQSSVESRRRGFVHRIRQNVGRYEKRYFFICMHLTINSITFPNVPRSA